MKNTLRYFLFAVVLVFVVLIVIQCKKKSKDVKGCMDPKSLNYNSAATIDDGSCQYNFQGPVNPSFENNSDWGGSGTYSTGTSFMPTNGISYMIVSNQIVGNTSSSITPTDSYQDNVYFDHSSTLTFDYALDGVNNNGNWNCRSDSIWTVKLSLLFTSNGTVSLWNKTVTAMPSAPGGTITLAPIQKLNETVSLPSLPDKGRLTIRVESYVTLTYAPASCTNSAAHQPMSANLRIDNFRVQ